MTDGLSSSSTIDRAPNWRVLVVVASVEGSLLKSDQAAASQAVARFGTGVMVSGPRDDETALGYALAAGAAEVVTIKPDVADLIVFGRGGIEPDGEQKAAKLALAMNACLIFDVLSFETIQQELIVTRDLGRGCRERLTVTFPAVLVMSIQAEPQTYISRFRRMQGAERVRQQLSSWKHGQPLERKTRNWGAARPRTRMSEASRKTAGDSRSRMFDAFGLANESKASTSEQHLVTGTAATCAIHLVRYLAHHGFVEARVPAIVEPMDSSLAGESHSVAPNKPAPSDPQRAAPPRLIAGREVELSKIARAPRPLTGAREGIWRSPRLYRQVMPRLTKLMRGPRPVGQAVPSNLRGPYPMHSDEP